MATWHQMQARKRKGFSLQHETEWSAVTDPPNQCCTIRTFQTRAEAVSWAMKQEHTFVLAPKGHAGIGYGSAQL